MKTIMLYGFLGREFGRVHRYDVRSPAEAVRAMCVTLQGFKKAVIDGGAYRVLIGGRDALDVERLPNPVSDKETIRIVPVIAGAGNGTGQFILGAVLVVVGAFTTFFGDYSGSVISLGVSLMVGGASQMLFGQKGALAGANDRPENRPSYTFDGAVNTAAQGNAVPIGYGRLVVGSQVVSAGLSVEQI